MERSRRSPADKFEERRQELAASALHTLGELGYARTSLREVAQRSAFSHGVLHYYFADKLELITFAVRQHKSGCVHRYDDIVATAVSADDLASRFAGALVRTVVEDGPMHMLWYDVRTASMFEAELRPTVTEVDEWVCDMVWRVVSRYAELAGRPVGFDRATAYGAFDGLFQRALLGAVGQREAALTELVDQVHGLLPLTLGPAARTTPRAAQQPVR